MELLLQLTSVSILKGGVEKLFEFKLEAIISKV